MIATNMPVCVCVFFVNGFGNLATRMSDWAAIFNYYVLANISCFEFD